MSDAAELMWSDLERAAARMFTVWADGTELAWAREAWGHLFSAGLVGEGPILDETAGKLRLVALARIYHEFCGAAWGEDPETPITYLAEDLDIAKLALGVLAGSQSSGELDDAEDDEELLELALLRTTDKLRRGIFECLKAAYGGDIQLYTRMWHTRSSAPEDETEGDEFEVTAPNAAAIEYVMKGFRSG